MKNKLQSIISFIGAPCLGIDFYRHAGSTEQWDSSDLTRILDILYMAGWICTMLAFIRMQVNGPKKSARSLLFIQLVFLFLAASSDLVTLLKIPVPKNIFFYWDLFWPASNCMMLVTGISIAVARRMTGWRRWVPLVTGMWLPVIMALQAFLSPGYTAYVGGTYSIIMWSIMAYVAHSNSQMEISHEPARLLSRNRPRSVRVKNY